MRYCLSHRKNRMGFISYCLSSDNPYLDFECERLREVRPRDLERDLEREERPRDRERDDLRDLDLETKFIVSINYFHPLFDH